MVSMGCGVVSDWYSNPKKANPARAPYLVGGSAGWCRWGVVWSRIGIPIRRKPIRPALPIWSVGRLDGVDGVWCGLGFVFQSEESHSGPRSLFGRWVGWMVWLGVCLCVMHTRGCICGHTPAIHILLQGEIVNWEESPRRSPTPTAYVHVRIYTYV